jgi:hypothetical protein
MSKSIPFFRRFSADCFFLSYCREDVEESIPYKLAEGDKITMGSTVLLVHLSALHDDE